MAWPDVERKVAPQPRPVRVQLVRPLPPFRVAICGRVDGDHPLAGPHRHAAELDVLGGTSSPQMDDGGMAQDLLEEAGEGRRVGQSRLTSLGRSIRAAGGWPCR